ncbi:MAG: sulfurtransferase [Proteobacteria bacterium SG_bin7]|nr:MAG: sulfurtransferase [Proteobacteria bacterium SG_bin7]
MSKQTTIEFATAMENPSVPGVLDISPEEFKQKKDKVIAIDVRRHDEWIGELGHIAGCRLITLDVLNEGMDEFPKDATIVFICRSGGRSARASAIAQARGFKSVYNLKGGMMLWNELKYEVTTEEE